MFDFLFPTLFLGRRLRAGAPFGGQGGRRCGVVREAGGDVGDELMLLTYYLTLLDDYKRNSGKANGTPRFTIVRTGAAATGLAGDCPTAVGNGRSMRVHPVIDKFVAGLRISRNTAIHGKRILFDVSPMRCRTTMGSTGTTIRATGTTMGARRLAMGGGHRLGGGGVVDSCSLRVTRGRLTRAGTRLTRTGTRLIGTGGGLSCADMADPDSNMMNDVPCHINDLIDPSMTDPLAAITSVSRVCTCFSVARHRLLSRVHRNNDAGRVLRGVPGMRLRLVSKAVCTSDNHIRAVDKIVSRAANSMAVHTLFPGGRGILHDKDANGIMFPGPLRSIVVVPRSTAARVRSGRFMFMLRPSGALGGARIGIFDLSSNGCCCIARNLGTNRGVIVRKMRGLGSKRSVAPVAPTRGRTRCRGTLGSRGRNGVRATFR